MRLKHKVGIITGAAQGIRDLLVDRLRAAVANPPPSPNRAL